MGAITESEAIRLAVENNYLCYGNYTIDIERRPAERCETRMMSAINTANFVIPCDLFIIIAVWYSGVATSYSVAAILNKMREDNPDKDIIHVDVATEQRTKVVSARLKKLDKLGIFYKRRVLDNNSERQLVTYTVSPEAVRIAFAMLEMPVNFPTEVTGTWGERREFLRQLLVSRFITYNLSSTAVKHFARYKRIPKQGIKRAYHEFTYLWFSSEKNQKKYSVMVYPFVFTNDPAITNEYENQMKNVEIPFRKLNDFLLFCESDNESTGGLVLIVDRESDLGTLANMVKKYIPEQYHQTIMLTSSGLLGTQSKETMYFSVNGKFFPEDAMFF